MLWMVRVTRKAPNPVHSLQGAAANVRAKLSRSQYHKRHGEWERLLEVATAADIIRQSGYPLEEHEVISADGYIMRMERIPRKGASKQVLHSTVCRDTLMHNMRGYR